MDDGDFTIPQFPVKAPPPQVNLEGGLAEVRMEPDNEGLAVEVAFAPSARQRVIEFNAARQQAKALVSALETGGKQPKAVAEQINVDWTSSEVKAATEMLLAKWEMPAEKRKRLVRAKLNEILLTGDNKEATNAAKAIGGDPEIGLNQPAVVLNQNFAPSADFLTLLGSDDSNTIEVTPDAE